MLEKSIVLTYFFKNVFKKSSKNAKITLSGRNLFLFFALHRLFIYVESFIRLIVERGKLC